MSAAAHAAARALQQARAQDGHRAAGRARARRGGLAARAGVEIEEDQEVTEDDAEVDTMDSLRERAEEWTEDIEDRESVLAKEPEAEAELSEELQKEAES